MISSYCALEQGQGSSTGHNGRPTRSACASTRDRRTACIATRFAALLNVVTSATIRTSFAVTEDAMPRHYLCRYSMRGEYFSLTPM